jgi:hypothetical protein
MRTEPVETFVSIKRMFNHLTTALQNGSSHGITSKGCLLLTARYDKIKLDNY